MARENRLSRILHLALAVAFLLGLCSTLVAQEDANLVEYRQKLMSGQGASMGSIGDYMKYKLTYSTDQIVTHARNIHEYSKLIEETFKKDISAGATDAKTEIWGNWDDFVAKSKAVTEASAALVEAAESGDKSAMMPAVGKLGGACRSCHNTYRKPREESYKNK